MIDLEILNHALNNDTYNNDNNDDDDDDDHDHDDHDDNAGLFETHLCTKSEIQCVFRIMN